MLRVLLLLVTLSGSASAEYTREYSNAEIKAQNYVFLCSETLKQLNLDYGFFWSNRTVFWASEESGGPQGVRIALIRNEGNKTRNFLDLLITKTPRSAVPPGAKPYNVTCELARPPLPVVDGELSNEE